MPFLVQDIVLPAEPLSNRIKRAFGRGGVAASMRRAGVPPLAADFMDVQSRIDEVTGFAHGLWERHVLDAEMPVRVINVSRVNYLVGQVLNGGFSQFVQNSGWDRSFLDGVKSGLTAIGAEEHAAVFEGAVRLIDEAHRREGGDPDSEKIGAAIDQLEREYFSDYRLSRRLSRSVDDSWFWGERWQSAQMLSARYIDGWRDVRRVPIADYPAALDALAAGIPDLAARRSQREESRPWEKKVIDRLVAGAGLDHVWYTAFSAREHNARKVWCWNLTVGQTPGEGHHQVIFVDGEAIMYEGSTDRVVARMPAPQAAPEGGVSSNAPSIEPGTEHPNISIMIANP
jgi:hypothetical protein